MREQYVMIVLLTSVLPVRPSIVERPESQTRPRAGTARFMCQAEGVPQPRISWLKNGQKVHLNGRIKMYNRQVLTIMVRQIDVIITVYRWSRSIMGHGKPFETLTGLKGYLNYNGPNLTMKAWSIPQEIQNIPQETQDIPQESQEYN